MSNERVMLDLLRRRYSMQYGNGTRYAIAEHVRSAAGFDATRTADFIAMDLWPSKGLAFHGHEVKVSRSDWLTELKDPTKADEFKRYMDYWWLVVSDPAIVRGDLPSDWGLLVAAKATRSHPGEPSLDHLVSLRVARPAPRLTPDPIPKTMLASLLRATAKTARAAVTTNS